jgi:polar amino acid transport system substrate-binding protein
MYKILVLILLPLILFSYEMNKKYKVVVPKDWKPYYYINEDNKIDGYSIEMFDLIAKESKINFEYIIVDNWKELFTLVKDGKADIIPNIGITKKRSEYLAFSQPTDTFSIGLFKRKSSFNIKTNKDLENKKIALVLSNVCEKLIKKEMFFDIRKYKDFTLSINALISGEVDALCYPSSLMQIKLNELNLSNEIIPFGQALYEVKRGVGISESEFGLLPIIDESITNLKLSGEYQKVYSKWFSYNQNIEFTRDELIFISFIIIISFLLIIFYIFYFTNKKRWILTRKDLEKEILKKTKELHKLSITDKLTGIYNRSILDEVIQNRIDISNRTKEQFFVVMIDIDHFKKVNDEYGHLVGDKVLIEFTSIIKSNIRKTDVFGRWGGEEFLIISSHDNINILQEIQRIKTCIYNEVFETIGHKTASFGISGFKENDTLELILKRVDDALYEAKRNGRNQIVVK